jgi:hypothetical protein
LVLLTVFCFAVGGLATWKFLDVINRQSDLDAPSQTNVDEEINNQQKEASSEPEPAPEEKKPEDDTGDSNNASDSVETSEKKQVNFFVVDASQYGETVEVRAYADKISEDDGVCTIILSHETHEVTRTVKGSSGGTKTDCVVEIPLSEFKQSGTWQVVIHYSSPKSFGKIQDNVIIKGR